MTNPGQIRYTYGALAQASQDIARTQATVEGQLQEIRNAVGQLAVWDGAASDYYRQQQAEIDRAWADLNQMLGTIGTRTQQVNEQAQQTDQGIQRLFAT